MGPVKIVRVVSFSSEDSNQPAENLTKNDTFRKWRCKGAGESKAWVELQLEQLCIISSIDIGNYGSAFIEVLVGRTGNTEDEYKVLLHSSTFMTPQECRNGTNLQRVRMFKGGELNKPTLTEKWDRIRVVCTQPFNKQLQYGLSFITIHAEDEFKPTSPQEKSKIDFGIFKLKEETATEPDTQGTLFSRFKSLKSRPSNESSTPQPGWLGSASESLAAAAIKESEQEASRILKPSPRKADERPNINLLKKLKASVASPESRSIAKSTPKETNYSPLPRRNCPVVDNVLPPSPSVSSPREAKKEKKTPRNEQKVEERKLHNTNEKDSEHSSKIKRKSLPKDDENVLVKKRKNESKSEAKTPSKKKRQTKPFNRLLEGAVVVLSGFQNPLRSQLRDKLQAMGAKYKPDWGSSCTHLICAFYNTPKFQEVKGKGKIVTKEWAEECYKQRKRLPWRRYCLDKSDRGDESEEEIWEGEDTSTAKATISKAANNAKSLKPSTGAKDVEDDYGGSTEVDEPDTDDEIERIKKNQR